MMQISVSDDHGQSCLHSEYYKNVKAVASTTSALCCVK